MLARSENPLTTTYAPSQPARSAATAPRRTRRTASRPARGAHWATTCAPEELPERVHLGAPVVEVDIEVAVDVHGREHRFPRRVAPHPRANAGSSPSPRYFQKASASRAGTAAAANAAPPASAEPRRRRAPPRPPGARSSGFVPIAAPNSTPASAASQRRSGASERAMKSAAASTSDHRRIVGGWRSGRAPAAGTGRPTSRDTGRRRAGSRRRGR